MFVDEEDLPGFFAVSILTPRQLRVGRGRGCDIPCGSPWVYWGPGCRRAPSEVQCKRDTVTAASVWVVFLFALLFFCSY